MTRADGFAQVERLYQAEDDGCMYPSNPRGTVKGNRPEYVRASDYDAVVAALREADEMVERGVKMAESYGHIHSGVLSGGDCEGCKWANEARQMLGKTGGA